MHLIRKIVAVVVVEAVADSHNYPLQQVDQHTIAVEVKCVEIVVDTLDMPCCTFVEAE